MSPELHCTHVGETRLTARLLAPFCQPTAPTRRSSEQLRSVVGRIETHWFQGSTQSDTRDHKEHVNKEDRCKRFADRWHTDFLCLLLRILMAQDRGAAAVGGDNDVGVEGVYEKDVDSEDRHEIEEARRGLQKAMLSWTERTGTRGSFYLFSGDLGSCLSTRIVRLHLFIALALRLRLIGSIVSL